MFSLTGACYIIIAWHERGMPRVSYNKCEIIYITIRVYKFKMYPLRQITFHVLIDRCLLHVFAWHEHGMPRVPYSKCVMIYKFT